MVEIRHGIGTVGVVEVVVGAELSAAAPHPATTITSPTITALTYIRYLRNVDGQYK